MPGPFYVTTSIPYVNAAPHVGHALEFVQADVLARHRRRRGDPVRFLTGTDDHALKNVQAAEQLGVDVASFVAANASRFEALRDALGLSFDDFIRTSADPRHRPAVERLWLQCRDAGDLYRKRYAGLYCSGCEQFFKADELEDGRCPEHRRPPELVAEENWFFRLSRYQEQIRDLLERDVVAVRPEQRRNEVLKFVEQGLEDFSISRSAGRARGWGIPVPGDASQIVYVWYDALANYISALGYAAPGADYARWWTGSASRVHVIGKGILRFHAVYWPALLLSAGQPLPTQICVHDYLTVDGRKISKSAGNTVDPTELAGMYGSDALRWWLLRDVPRTGDADFSVARLIHTANQDLANDLGNLVQRTRAMVERYRPAGLPARAPEPAASALRDAIAGAPARVDAALAEFDFRSALDAVWRIVSEANRWVEHSRPWDLYKQEQSDPARSAALDAVLGTALAAQQVIADELEPFLPELARRMKRALGGQREGPLFARIETS